jgi:hypothetical protein
MFVCNRKYSILDKTKPGCRFGNCMQTKKGTLKAQLMIQGRRYQEHVGIFTQQYGLEVQKLPNCFQGLPPPRCSPTYGKIICRFKMNSDENNLSGALGRLLRIEAPPAQVRDDENLAIQLLMQERQAQEAEDLRIATFLNINGYMPPPQPPNPAPIAHEASDLALVPAPNPHQIPAAFPDEAGVHTEHNLFVRHTCAVCQEQFSTQRIAQLPCGHNFCEGSKLEHFQCAMTDEQLFPQSVVGAQLL